MAGYTYAEIVNSVYLYHGQIVEGRDGKLYRIVKINPKKVRIEDQAGELFNADRGFLTPSEREFVSQVPAVKQRKTGAVVLVKDSGRSTKWTYAPDQAFVVLRDAGDGRTKIVKLGGSETVWTVASRDVLDHPDFV